MPTDDFHRPLCFEDNDEFPDFRRGQLKDFKKRLKEHADKKGYTEEAKRNWRNGNQQRRKRSDEQ